jgi:HEPN domain-containing protein/predicted nucleotidyltransferase
MIELKDSLEAQELEEIVKRVVGRFHPDQILLYGSFAYGTPHEESDFDLLVILPNPPAGKDGWAAAHEIKVKRMLQLVFMKPALFEEEKDVVGGLAYPARHWGKLLYSRSPESTGRPPSESPSRTREQVIWDFIQGWIKRAESRLKMVEISLMEKLNDYSYAGFYSQMAAENYLRAFLAWRQIPNRKTREIQKYLDLFPAEDASLARELAAADWLSPYGEDFPDPASPPVDPETGREAIAEAKRVKSLILERLESYLAKGRPGGSLSAEERKTR